MFQIIVNILFILLVVNLLIFAFGTAPDPDEVIAEDVETDFDYINTLHIN